MERGECKASRGPYYKKLIVTDIFQGFTTASQKLNRRAILEKYKKEVDQAYAGTR